MLEINLANLQKNVDTILKTNRKLIGVVKNNAYGCGSVMISRHLIKLGVDFLLVNDIREAQPLLNSGIFTPILIHNSMTDDDLHILRKHPNLIPTINNVEDALRMINYAKTTPITVHLQIDTKMNRLGFKDYDQFLAMLNSLQSEKNIIIQGIYTHFAALDSMDEQIEKFKKFVETYPFLIVHCGASATYQHTDFGNYVRVGLDLYHPHQVMSVKANPIDIREIAKGETIGYFGTYVAQKDMRIAVLPIGYGNGYRRKFEGFYLVCEQKQYPIVGRICMNHTFVEVDASINTNSVFEFTSPNLPAQDLANYIGSSNYEIYTMFIFDKVKYIL